MDEMDLNVATALDAVGGDDELLAQVMQVFIDKAPPLWQALASPDIGDADAQQIAHRLKGGAGSIGAQRLANCVADIEKIIRQGQGAGWRHLQPQLLQLGEQVQVCVRGYLSKRLKRA